MQWVAVAQLVLEILKLFKKDKGLREDLHNAKTSEDKQAVAINASSQLFK